MPPFWAIMMIEAIETVLFLGLAYTLDKNTLMPLQERPPDADEAAASMALADTLDGDVQVRI